MENGLTPNAMKVLNAVRAAFPGLSIGGNRGGGDDHGTGKALDIMTPSAAVGDAVAAFVQSHSSALGVEYVIWRQRIWNASGSGWRSMSDRGSPTANHMDHVHVSVR